MDEQIMPSKTKRSKMRQYNPKKPREWGFQNLVRAGASGFMYDFYIYGGKKENVDPEYQSLQKCTAVVANLCKDLPHHHNHKLFFGNWFTTLPLLHKLAKMGILAVGTITLNRIQNCPLQSDRDLPKNGRGALECRVDHNSVFVVVKWMDNKAVELASNFVGVEPISSIERWDKATISKKGNPRSQVVIACNKSMGGVDLADMMIALYRIRAKTKHWYIKVFWHLIDI